MRRLRDAGGIASPINPSPGNPKVKVSEALRALAARRGLRMGFRI